MEKKYKITKNEKVIRGRKLYQIEALKAFGKVKKGELGGWIEKERNLDQEGLCWVSENARVYGDATVYENANVSGNAKVYGEAKVFGTSEVKGKVEVCEKAKICGGAYLTMPIRYIGGEFFDSRTQKPQYELIDQSLFKGYDKKRDKQYVSAIDPQLVELSDEIVQMQEIIDQQAYEIEELKKKIKPEPKA